MYILLVGESPFKGSSYDEVVTKNYNCEINTPFAQLEKKLSRNCLDLLKKLLKRNPKERISTTDAINHPFFNFKTN